MTRSAHSDLAALTDMLFQAEQSKMRHVVAREAELRRDIARLEDSRRANLALPDAHLRAARQIGADVQWQAWLGRKRAGLNQQLALCLVQKERMMAALRRAHGRKLAAEQIVSADQLTQRRTRDKADIASEESLSMLKRFQALERP